ncbi:MAG: hypothetical protein JJ896_00475 [Rhodothermales bacterium]|nr:hypothetical protein [Rhodothermales bacterium]MBO6778101.1 hypothetical protein [Rhodothermales bacterium]
MRFLPALLLALFLVLPTSAQDDPLDGLGLNALSMRNVGPAFTSGRIADIAVHPEHIGTWYVAVGSGGVWKTENWGTTWTSVFDGQGSYSIGCLTLDPNNPDRIWVGTGENVGGRHVAYGDGIYLSNDGGRTWTNKGLPDSEHLSKIIVHPDDPNTVWVASQGPLWAPGGERGVYKTTDGGDTWTRTLGDDEWVGATDLLIDPRDPDVLYAATWQRHRNVASYMGGGPGTGVHKSTDGGETWTELTRGLPGGNMGKIGLAMSYHDPDQLWAAIELDHTTGGVFMTTDRGASWRKMSDAVAGATGPHYYQEIFASPHHEGRLFLMDASLQMSEDYGATFTRVNRRNKHGDNHAIAFLPGLPDYYLMGTDGGLFETFDDAATWKFIGNLPVTQYYKVAVDDSEPFYLIYGGTQDNGSHGGPSATDNRHGIRNADWFKTLGADGHQSATEPGNPNITYAESQQGGLARIDRLTGEQVSIQPQPGPGEPYERYNWDAPIVVSPHDPATLYFASYRVWKSENRGDSWTAISGDLTRNQERFELPIMGRVQSWDNAWDLNAMSVYNTISSIDVSRVQPGLVYAGTDDGLFSVSEDDGDTWRTMEVGDIRGVPQGAFVNHVYADLHDADVVYMALDNHKFGDLEPYLVKSTDRGQTWSSLAADLPERTLIWRIVQDHEDPNLIFLGTEFGVQVTTNGGTTWHDLPTGGATISFRDVVIQRRENDLVGASFGRGFFVLDDYTPLRNLDSDALAADGHIFPVKTARQFIPRDVEGGAQGHQQYAAPNPTFGAVFTYHLNEGWESMERARQKREREAGDADLPFPGWDALEAERNEVPASVELVVRNMDGDVVSRVEGRTGKGLHRTAWNLRFDSNAPVVPGERSGGGGFMAPPGTYTVTLTRTVNGEMTDMSGPVSFDVVPLRDGALDGASPEEILAFMQEVEAMQAEVTTFTTAFRDAQEMVEAMQTAHSRADRPSADLAERLHNARATLLAIDQQVRGYRSKSQAGERNAPSPQSRMFAGFRGLSTSYGPTPLHRATMEAGKVELAAAQEALHAFLTEVLPSLESGLATTGAPPIQK